MKNVTGFKEEKIIYGGKENHYITESEVKIYPNVPSLDLTEGNVDQFTHIITKNFYTDEDFSKWHIARLTKSSVIKRNERSTGDRATYDLRSSCFSYHKLTGLLISQTENCDHPKAVTTNYEHDNYGNTVLSSFSAIDVERRKDVIVYNDLGRLPISTTNTLGHTSEILEFDHAKAIPLISHNVNGLMSRVYVDDFGNVVKSIDPTGLESSVSHRFVENGCTENKQSCYKSITQSGTLPPVWVLYDAAGRELETRSQGFQGKVVSKRTEYDLAGRTVKSSIPMFESDYEGNYSKQLLGKGIVVEESCSDLYKKLEHDGIYKSPWTYFFYDELGREKATLLPDGGLLCTDHRFRQKNSYDQLANYSSSMFDYQLRPTLTIDALGSETQFFYDVAGRLIETKNALGQSILHNYSELGEKISTEDPDLGYWRYEYDALGQLTKQTDAKGQVTYLYYDLLGRLIKKSQDDKTSRWHYDGSPKGIGQLSWVSDDNGYLERYFYDEFSRQINVNTVANGEEFRQSVSYDDLGRVATLTSPTGFIQKNVFDEYGLLYLVEAASINSSFEPHWQAITYDAVGRVVEEKLGNGVATYAKYDQYSGHLLSKCSQLTDAQLSRCIESNDYIQYQYYEYDLADNLTRKVDVLTRRDMQHTFDALGRLETVYHKNRFNTDAIEYDAIGNFQVRSGFGRYDYASDGMVSRSRLMRVQKKDGSVISYQYDANGNSVKSDKGVFSYTADNLVSEIRKNKSHFSKFQYTPGGQRYFQRYRHGRRHIKTTYLGGYEKIEEIGAEPLLPTSERIRHRHYIAGPNGVVGVVEEIDWFYPLRHNRKFELLAGFERPVHTVNHTVKTIYFLKDSLGSITTVLNNTGEVIDRFEYDALG